jgi:hypothetical protein
MQLKTVTIDGKTYAEVSDGKPLYVQDGKDIAFDAPQTVQTISRLNGEAKGHREAKEAAEAALKSFDGLDAGKARDAIEKLSKIDAKKLVESGDMDAAIKAAVEPFTDELATLKKTNSDLSTQLQKAVIGAGFSQSKFASEKLTPAGVDLVRTMFGDRLKVENGLVFGIDANGQKLYSKARPGEAASFDEVVETLVESYPFKEHILKGTGHQGTGKEPGARGHGGSQTKVLPKTEFDAMDPKGRAAFMTNGGQIAE